MARIVPNRIAVAKGRSTATTPSIRPAKSSSRIARSRSCVVLTTAAAAGASSCSDGTTFAINHLSGLAKPICGPRQIETTARKRRGFGATLIEGGPFHNQARSAALLVFPLETSRTAGLVPWLDTAAQRLAHHGRIAGHAALAGRGSEFSAERPAIVVGHRGSGCGRSSVAAPRV